MKFITQKEIEVNNYYESSYWGAGFEPDGDVCDQLENNKEVWGSGFVGITNTGYVVFADEASYRLHRANLDEVAVENPEEKKKRMAVIARWKRALL